MYSPVILLSCTAVHAFLRSFRSSLRRKRSLLHPTIHPECVCVPPRARSVLLTARPRLRLLSHGLPDFQFGLPFFVSPQFHLFIHSARPCTSAPSPMLSLTSLILLVSLGSELTPRFRPRNLRDPLVRSAIHRLIPSSPLSTSPSLSPTHVPLFFFPFRCLNPASNSFGRTLNPRDTSPPQIIPRPILLSHRLLFSPALSY